MTNREAWRGIEPSRPLRRMGHAHKHYQKFLRYDPALTEIDVARILEYVKILGRLADKTSRLGRHGAKVYEDMVEIGGQRILVRVVETSSGNIKTGFPVEE